MKKRYDYRLLTFYKFVDVPNPHNEVEGLKKYCTDIGMRGRIYIGEEGINAQCSAKPGQKEALLYYLDNHPLFGGIEDIDSKETPVDSHKFPRMIVRYRREIVALGITYNAENIDKAKYKLPVDSFKDIIDNKNQYDYLILDMRNDYEYELGHFRNAYPAGTMTFKETERYIDKYREIAGNKEVIMYCTGGIRCEKLAAMLQISGMENVKQLEGGVIKYINKFDDGNWLGNLYTFDDRVSTHVGSDETHTIIGRCHYSGNPAESMFNCRYGICNKQIIAEPEEYKRHLGFCSESCWKNAASDLNIRDAEFDELNYKDLRSRYKKGESSKPELSEIVYNHLSENLRKVTFRNHVLQEEFISVDRHVE